MPVVPGEIMLKTNMDYDSVKAAGSALGTGAVIIMDETTCMVRVLERISRFYMSESCGQCTPCREGTGWMNRLLKRVLAGQSRREELGLLLDVANRIEGHTICAFGRCLGLAGAELPQALSARVRIHDRSRRPQPRERYARSTGSLAPLSEWKPFMADDLVNIEIDGVAVKAKKGDMIIRATDASGAYVPRFCYHEKLAIAANCRMCLVEVEKAPKPLPACATPVAEGMKIFTKSPEGDRRAARHHGIPAHQSSRWTARSATRAGSASCRTWPSASDAMSSRYQRAQTRRAG